MADVVGYSRLMAADEEGTLAQLTANRKELIIPKEARYRGRTIKLMGDGALMEFGSVTDALNFAVDVQTAIIRRNQDIPESRQISYRIGIHIGEMIIDGNDLYGSGVNICSRLESICEPNGIFLSEQAYRQVENNASFSFRSLGKKSLKNIPDPVSVYQVLLDPASTPATRIAREPSGKGKLIAGLLVLLALAAFLGYRVLMSDSRPVADDAVETEASFDPAPADEQATAQKTSIAVLPFQNLSGDPEQEYFSDGVSEDIITDLSQLSELVVIARSSSFSYKDRNDNVQKIGADLGAAYLLQGSIRKAANRIRINTQLVEAATGHALWAERYEGDMADVFALQDEITGKIVNALSIRFTDATKRQITGTRTANFEAYDLFLQGRSQANRGNRQAAERGMDDYRKAIELDPGFARAYGALAVEMARYAFRGYAESPSETKDRAIQLAKQAVSIDPDSPHVQWALGYAYMINRQYELAIAALDRAVSLAPSYADGYGLLALIYNNLGRASEAIEFTNRAIALNPHYTWEFPYNLGRANWALKQYEVAVPYLEEALERNPASWNPSLYLIACYVEMGRLEDAEWVVTEMEIQRPEINLTHLIEIMPLNEPALRERLFSALRQAGMNE